MAPAAEILRVRAPLSLSSGPVFLRFLPVSSSSEQISRQPSACPFELVICEPRPRFFRRSTLPAIYGIPPPPPKMKRRRRRGSPKKRNLSGRAEKNQIINSSSSSCFSLPSLAERGRGSNLLRKKRRTGVYVPLGLSGSHSDSV